MDLVLGNSCFTEKLIEEHLAGPQQRKGQQAVFASRDPAAYRDFAEATYFSKDQEDPYTHFYIKESGKVERVHKVHNDAAEKYDKIIAEHPDPEVREKTAALKKTLDRKIEDMLLENQLENEDTLSLSH